MINYLPLNVIENPFRQLNKTVNFTILSLLMSTLALGQTYFPASHSIPWEQRTPEQFEIKSKDLEAAITFALENEYSGAKDLRIAILKGFEKEPYHKILGPTKKRGGPAGIILKDGYVIASWGETKRVDMTFSVTKSYLSTGMPGYPLNNPHKTFIIS